MADDEILVKLKNVNFLLQENRSLEVGDLTLESKNITELTIIGWTDFIHFENLTKRNSVIELNEMKEVFQLMLKLSKELADFARNKTIKYLLNYDDAGKCGIGICFEEDGQIFWQVQLRED